MFVRLKKRKLRRGGGSVFYAVLVESHRQDGKVRQKVVRHMAHIKEKYLHAPAHQQYFWQRVDWHLEDLKIEPGAREEIEWILAATVPRPSEEALAELARQRERYEAMWPARGGAMARSADENDKSAVS